MARKTPRSRSTGRPSGTATSAGTSAPAASTAAKGTPGWWSVRSAAAYPPIAMKPAFASESWPQESVVYTESARSAFTPMKPTTDW